MLTAAAAAAYIRCSAFIRALLLLVITARLQNFFHSTQVLHPQSVAHKINSVKQKQLPLLYFVMATLLVVGLLPLALAGWLLSRRSGQELRSIEGRYQAQLVQDKARQIELYGQRYRDVVMGLARAFELAGGSRAVGIDGSDGRLEKIVEEDSHLVALAILPVRGVPHVAYKPDVVSREEADARTADVLGKMNGGGIVISRPKLIRSSQEMCFAVGAPVMGKRGGGNANDEDEIVAAVVAIVSFSDVFRTVQQQDSTDEQQLLDSGVPVVFVVDEQGRAVAHPDVRLALNEREMTDLTVVRDWMEAGSSVGSALAPFTVMRDGRELNMLGSYATARFDKDASLGVIAIQNESAALTSVTDMRQQTLVISLIAAVFALVIGFFLARELARPVRDLAVGAHAIAAGDFSNNISVRRYTERTELGELASSFNSMSGQLQQHIEDLKHAAAENKQLFIGTIKALAAAIDGKDPYTRGHSERVARFSVAIAETMNLPKEEIEKIRISALLHDVGKIGVDDNILKKPSPLTDEEFEQMKQHPQKGYKIMSLIPAMKDYLPGILMHHEMINGGGYPSGLKGDEIPLQARIIAVADTFDACTTERPYQQAMKTEEALNILRKFTGTRYEPRVVAAMENACEQGTVRPGVARLTQRARFDSFNAPIINSSLPNVAAPPA